MKWVLSFSFCKRRLTLREGRDLPKVVLLKGTICLSVSTGRWLRSRAGE